MTVFAWLLGSWEDPRTHARETWVLVGERMLGVGFLAPGGPGVRYELLELTPEAYVARPGGGAPVAFALVRSGEEQATWENDAHDFPRRIAYRARGADGLSARLSGQGGAMGWRWSRREPTPIDARPGDTSADGELAFTVEPDGTLAVWRREGDGWVPP